MSATKIQLLGHATFKVTTPQGKIIIVDPWIKNNPFIPQQFKNIVDTDLFLITHGHDDHFDLEILETIHKNKSKVVANPAVRWYLIEHNCP